MFTIQDIEKDTGLNVAYIRRCLQKMDKIFSPHYNRGEYNQIQFTQSGYIIFDQIKQLKEEGLNLVQITKKMETLDPTHISNKKSSAKQPESSDQTQDQTLEPNIINHTSISEMRLFDKLFNEKEARLKERAEFQQFIMSQERQSLQEKTELNHKLTEYELLTNHLKGQLLYLTDGHTPEEVKQQWQQEQLEKQRIAWILKELENLEGIFSVVNYFKRKKLYKELKELMNKQADTTPNEQ